MQRGAAHCRSRERDLRITGGELERLPLLNLKAEPRHAKNRYQCNTSSTTRPREARVAKSGILPPERARLAQKEKRRKGRRGRLGQCRAPPVEPCALRTTGKITKVTSSLFAIDASETVLWCRCRQCGVAASPPHGDKQLPAVTTRIYSISASHTDHEIVARATRWPPGPGGWGYSHEDTFVLLTSHPRWDPRNHTITAAQRRKRRTIFRKTFPLGYLS